MSPPDHLSVSQIRGKALSDVDTLVLRAWTVLTNRWPGLDLFYWRRVRYDADSSCLVWNGSVNTSTKYGYRKYQGRQQPVHRWVYESVWGPIPEGFHIDHLCRNRRCVNPDHLEAVTPRENSYRGYSVPAQNHRKTHCKYGHPFAGDNLLWKKGRYSMVRECRICRNKSARDRARATRHEERIRNHAR